MCLAIPMKVLEKKGKFARVSVGRVERMVNLELLNRVKVGEYVIVHAGFAIQKLDAAEAKKNLGMLKTVDSKW